MSDRGEKLQTNSVVASSLATVRRNASLGASDRTVQITLFLQDFMILIVTTVVAMFGRRFLPIFTTGRLEVWAVPVSIATIIFWLAMLGAFSSYRAANLGTGVAEYKQIWKASITVALVLALLAFLFQYPLSRGYYAILMVLGFPMLISGRFLMRKLVHAIRRRGGLVTPTLVVGHANNAEDVIKVLRREPWLGYDVVGVVTPEMEATSFDVPLLGKPEDIVDTAIKTNVSAVIFTEGAFPTAADFRRMAWQLEDKRLDMVIVPALTDISAERLEIRPVAGLPLVHVAKPQALEASRWIKRVFDAVGSTLLILMAAPIIGLVAAAIKLEDGGPVFFKQLRTGRRGKPFYCYKFRSMCVDAEAKLAALADQNEGNGVLFKMSEDPRITKVGKFIRRFSIDEVPQFFNVLLGDMSLIGPRPALPSEVAQYDDDAMRRLQVRPGMSGLWQVSGRSDLSWEETVRLDLYYVDNWSFLQDMNILLRTFGAVVRSRGAY